jgi:hypothetical protein
VVIAHEDDLVWSALEQMIDEGFSQIPVRNSEGEISGIFSWQSFGKRALDLRGNKLDATELTVRDCMDEPVFISPETYIDTDKATDWSRIDYVLVGAPDNLIGILTTADVFGRLNDFAEAFVLLYEIELDLRDVIETLLTDEEREDVFKELTQPKAKPIRDLKDLSFSQYLDIMCSRDRWARFEPFFRCQRELVDADLKRINELRNDVFHFRRQITVRDTDRLRRFWERLRFNRQLHARGAGSTASGDSDRDPTRTTSA